MTASDYLRNTDSVLDQVGRQVRVPASRLSYAQVLAIEAVAAAIDRLAAAVEGLAPKP